MVSTSWCPIMGLVPSIIPTSSELTLLPQRLLYWDTDKDGQKITLSSNSIFSAIEGAESGAITAKPSENIMERIIRVSFTLPL